MTFQIGYLSQTVHAKIVGLMMEMLYVPNVILDVPNALEIILIALLVRGIIG